MKRALVCTSVALTLSLMSLSAHAARDVPGRKAVSAKSQAKTKARLVKLDPATSTLAWTGKKVTGSHHGTVKLKSGEVNLENDTVKGGQFVVDMTSIADEDLTDPTWNAKLIKHLRSDDFFGVEKHPTAAFKITGLAPIEGAAEGQPNYTVSGELTLKGKALPVTPFPAWISMKDGKAQAKGTMTIDRTLYDIRYGSGKFFEGLGDKMIDDHFKIELNLAGKM